MRVKICGITTPEDAVAAADAGADAIGINLVAGPRQVTANVACEILRAASPMCTPVALVDVSTGGVPGEYLELLGRYWVSHVQVYGAVTAGIMARLRSDGFVPLLVQHVVPNRFPADVNETLGAMSACPPAAIVLDAHQPGKLGGTGTPADWELIKTARDAGQLRSWPPIMLAGGLHPDNVAEAIRTVGPWAVDVSSGVESTVGRKDATKMREFMEQARSSIPQAVNMSHRVGPVYAPKDYAGFWRRTTALVLDAIILIAFYYFVAYAYYFFAPAELVTDRGYRYVSAATWVLSVVYLIAMRFSMRGTLGYRIVGIQYAYMFSEKPPWTQIALRSLLAVVLLWFLALDHLWILADQRKQAWHDKMSGFYVVRRSAEPLATVQMVQRAINVLTYTFVVWEPSADAPNAPDQVHGHSATI